MRHDLFMNCHVNENASKCIPEEPYCYQTVREAETLEAEPEEIQTYTVEEV